MREWGLSERQLLIFIVVLKIGVSVTDVVSILALFFNKNIQ